MKTDLLIIGGGLAGLTAAYEVLKAEPGRRITILRPGAGSSPYVHGFNMPLNPQDSTELFIQDTEASGRGQGNAALVEELCRGSLELLPFSMSLAWTSTARRMGAISSSDPSGHRVRGSSASATMPAARSSESCLPSWSSTKMSASAPRSMPCA